MAALQHCDHRVSFCQQGSGTACDIKTSVVNAQQPEAPGLWQLAHAYPVLHHVGMQHGHLAGLLLAENLHPLALLLLGGLT